MRVPITALAALALTSAAAAAPIRVGDTLTPFTLKDASGKQVSLASIKASGGVVLIFMATRCPVSNAYNQRMAALTQDYAGKGVTVIGINSNRQEDAAEIVQHAKEHGLSFPILKDTGNVEADAFGAQVTPEAFVFDPSWKLRYHGRIDDNQRGDNIHSQDLRAAIDAVLAGQAVPVPETKAFGCTIKRVAP